MSTKSRLLSLLEDNRGESISGENIARQLNVSRTAIWKAVKELEKDGYVISAVTNKGYCLSAENDILSVEGISKFLHRKDVKVLVYPSLDSTLTKAKQLAISDAEHGTVIIADHQTAGRGRYGRSFFSPQGHGIYMGVILRPSFIRLSSPTLVTAFAAVAVCEAVETVANCNPQIKWVNDVFLGGKKICGILTEAVSDYESGGIQWVVTGIGVNFTKPKEGIPSEWEDIIGAVFSNENEKPSTTRNQLAAEIINRMMEIESKDPNAEHNLMENYKKRMMMLGERIVVTNTGGKQSYEATAIDIDDAGQLIVKMDNGEILSLSSGEISIKQAFRHA
ncbi:MAG: biotin--[acetyl-CoA-carboxylase] ligase [Defluviitaleaceae bacterium]|nr:biotin--[acetyl-CoA-carboxylase] ligase [Defluviitaleaceae bacterium]